MRVIRAVMCPTQKTHLVQSTLLPTLRTDLDQIIIGANPSQRAHLDAACCVHHILTCSTHHHHLSVPIRHNLHFLHHLRTLMLTVHYCYSYVAALISSFTPPLPVQKTTVIHILSLLPSTVLSSTPYKMTAHLSFLQSTV